ncbi:MAG: hypothetical protein PVSMB8_14220 [Vulcanimicrobiaceae bacterium]
MQMVSSVCIHLPFICTLPTWRIFVALMCVSRSEEADEWPAYVMLPIIVIVFPPIIPFDVDVP